MIQPKPDAVDASDPVSPDEAVVACARLAAIVESSDDAIISKTLDGVITSWNGGAERIFGYTPAEAIGQSITMIIPGDRLQEEKEVLSRLRRGEKIDHFETVRQTKDGRLLDVSLTVSPIRDGTGRIVGASKVGRDITERKRIETERKGWLEREQRARRQAERAIQTMDEFLATVSHELRSPLNAIVGWAHLLKVGDLDAQRTARAIETITRNAMLQSQLISDILDVQSLASGKVRLDLQSIDLALVVEAAVDSARPAASAKSIVLRPSLDLDSSVIPGDPARIQQVIWNLLSNAVKFTPEGGTVSVSLRGDESQLEVSVEDSGPGVNPDFLPHVFERFRQDPGAVRRQGGLGLGLAIVRQLVELHGGSVSAHNRVGASGAVFTVCLPRVAQAQVNAVAGTAPLGTAGEPADAAPISLPGVRVLIVDDEPEAREVVAALLGERGADVTLAASAEEALALLGRVRPHVLVSDIQMADQDGYSLMRAIRALPDADGGLTPAVALTAAATTDDRMRALGAGYQFHVAKPVQPNELTRLIASLVSYRPGGGGVASS